MVDLAQRQLGPGHQGGLVRAAKGFVQLVGGVVERALALGLGPAPEGGLGFEPGEVAKGEADLAHRFAGPAHHLAEDLLQHGVDVQQVLEHIAAKRFRE